MDSDDIALPCRIEKQVDFLENNPNIFLIGSAVIIINEDDQEINRIYYVAKPSLLAKRLTIVYVSVKEYA